MEDKDKKQQPKIDTKSIVGRFAYSNRRFGGIRNSSKGGKNKSKDGSQEKIAEQEAADAAKGIEQTSSDQRKDSAEKKQTGSKEKIKSGSSFQGSLSSLLRSRGNKSGQRGAQESPGGSKNKKSNAAAVAAQGRAGSEDDPDFDGDEEMHQPKQEEQSIQINSPLQPGKESRVNMHEKNNNMAASVAEFDDDRENIDDSYNMHNEEKQNPQFKGLGDKPLSSRKRGGPSDVDEVGMSPSHQKVPQSQKPPQKIYKDQQNYSVSKNSSKQSNTQRDGVRAGGPVSGKPNQMVGSASQQILPKTSAVNNQFAHNAISQSQVQSFASQVPHRGANQHQQQITVGNRFSIIGGNSGGNVAASNIPQQTMAAPVGRRLDQVQTRRRRMKNARSMKALYWHVDGIASKFLPAAAQFNESRDIGEISMEFSEAPTAQTKDGKGQSKRLKLIDVLIDIKVSVKKIEQQVLLAEDGNLYKIETVQDLEDSFAQQSLQGQFNAQNQSSDQYLALLNESHSQVNQNQSHMNTSQSAGGGDPSPNSGSAHGSSQQLSFLSNSSQKVSILQVKFIQDEGPLSSSNHHKSPGAIKSSVSSRSADRVSDIGVTRNGLVYATEKGETYLAISMRYQVTGINQSDSAEYYLNQLFATRSQSKKLQEQLIQNNDQNLDDPIFAEDQQEVARGNQNDALASSAKNHLNDLEFNEVNLGDQFDQQQSVVEDELDSVAARNYFNDFKLPLITIPLKQIQSTFISKVACGLEHALLLTSSGFIYSMGQNTWGQLGGEQGIDQSSPDYPNESYNQGASVENEKHGAYPPQMIFALMNIKVSDIQCGYYHSIAVGTPRSSTVAYTTGIGGSNQVQFGAPNQGNRNYAVVGDDKPLYQGYQDYNNRQRAQRQMVFAWGCNTNHQLGLFQTNQEQVAQVNEPTIIEELLQYSHIRKIKCQANSTMILVDSPNTLLVFNKRTQPEGTPAQSHRESQSKTNKKEPKKTENIIDADEDKQDQPGHVQIEHSSVYTMRPKQDLGELFVDFVLIDKPQSVNHFDSIEQQNQSQQAYKSEDLAVLFSTNYSDVILKFLDPDSAFKSGFETKVIYQNSMNKSLINDHYLSSICYLPHPVDKLLTVSQIRPDIQYQERIEQEQKEKQGDGVGSTMQQAGYAGAPGVGIPGSQSSVNAPPQFAYPFHSFTSDDYYDEESYGSYSRSGHSADVAPYNDQAVFGNAHLMRGRGQGIQKQKTQQPQSVSKTLGSVFSQEWKDLLKFMAVSRGNTKVPKGMEPMSYRPNNLPRQTDAEIKKVNQLVEENRREYMLKQKQKKEEATRKIQNQLQKEERLAKIWEKDILDDWDNMKSTSKCRELWTEGIPKRIRAIVWYRAIGNKSVISKSLFNIMAERGRKLSELLDKHQQIENQIIENGGTPQDVEQKIQNLKQSQAQTGGNEASTRLDTNVSEGQKKELEHDSEILEELYLKYYKIRKKLLMLIQIDHPSYSVQQREKSISLIEQDIKRTFADLSLFQEGMKYHDSLFKILRAFAMYRPDIGYVQGMSYIAAIVLLYIQDEYKAFMNFSNLMLKYPIMPFYTFNEDFVAQVLQLFKQLFQINLPDLCDHFEMEEIKPRQYVYKWIMTLFSRSLPLRIVSHVWDLYFLDGIFILYQTSIAILRLLRPKLMQEDMEGILHILQNVENHITEEDEDKLVDSIFNLVYPQWVYEEIPKLEINHLNMFT